LLRSFLAIFLSSRIFLFAVVALTVQLQLFPEPFGNTTLLHPFLTVPGEKLQEELYSVLSLGDASHYGEIVSNGYTETPVFK
jgi:hypothetical protein